MAEENGDEDGETVQKKRRDGWRMTEEVIWYMRRTERAESALSPSPASLRTASTPDLCMHMATYTAKSTSTALYRHDAGPMSTASG